MMELTEEVARELHQLALDVYQSVAQLRDRIARIQENRLIAAMLPVVHAAQSFVDIGSSETLKELADALMQYRKQLKELGDG